MLLSLDIVEWILLGALLCMFVVQVYFYIRYLAAPMRALRKKNDQTVNDQMVNDQMVNNCGVSVLVSARNAGFQLRRYLPALLTQDYPEYEVIVVDDGSEDDTRDVIEQYMTVYPNLHTTFVPKGARVGSTKKLALTLAAKAAQYDYLLLTDADCVPESNQWIREMMSGFRNSTNDQRLTTNDHTTDLVLGFGAYFFEPTAVNRIVRYDTLFNGLHYLGAALCGHPYMGVGRNLAYRKSLFFESGGFTHLMTNTAGDDDLFVNHVATPTNTAVVLSPDSYTWSPAKSTMRQWWQQKRRHLSVSPSYRPETKRRLVVEPLTRGLFYALVIALIIYQLPITNNQLPIPLLAAVGLFLLRWLMQILVINLSARRMHLHGFGPLAILGLDIWLPLVNLWMLVIPKRKTKW